MAKTQFKLIGSEDELYLASDLYTKSEVNQKIGSVIHYKGSKATYADLPTTGQQVGDMWNIKATGKNYVWAENPEMKDPPEPGWDDISTTVDLSNYYTKDQVNDAFATTGDLATTNQAVSGKQDKINLNSGILKATSNGIVAAVADTDYATPSSVTAAQAAATGYAYNLTSDLTITGPWGPSYTLTLSPSASTAPEINYSGGYGLGVSATSTSTGVDITYYAASATTLQAGVVQLSDSITGSSHTKAATEYAVSAALASAKAYVDSFDTGVTSVNGKTGTVTLGARDVSAVPMSGAADVGGLSFKTNANIFLSGGCVSAFANGGDDHASYYGDKIVLQNPSSSGNTYSLYFPSYDTVGASGTLAVQSSTLSGYGITDAKIENGTITLGNQSITPLVASDISDMATKTWVGQQGYLTSSSISDMATKTWVGQQGYLKAADVSGKVDKSTLTTYLTTGSGGVLEQFPTTGYNLAQLVAHYNVLLGALEDIIGAIS